MFYIVRWAHGSACFDSLASALLKLILLRNNGIAAWYQATNS